VKQTFRDSLVFSFGVVGIGFVLWAFKLFQWESVFDCSFRSVLATCAGVLFPYVCFYGLLLFFPAERPPEVVQDFSRFWLSGRIPPVFPFLLLVFLARLGGKRYIHHFPRFRHHLRDEA